MDKMLSLYDYLGRAAGMELGGEVYKVAVAENIPMEIRIVNTATYSGEITLYPKSFLERYFEDREGKQIHIEF